MHAFSSTNINVHTNTQTLHSRIIPQWPIWYTLQLIIDKKNKNWNLEKCNTATIHHPLLHQFSKNWNTDQFPGFSSSQLLINSALACSNCSEGRWLYFRLLHVFLQRTFPGTHFTNWHTCNSKKNSTDEIDTLQLKCTQFHPIHPAHFSWKDHQQSQVVTYLVSFNWHWRTASEAL